MTTITEGSLVKAIVKLGLSSRECCLIRCRTKAKKECAAITKKLFGHHSFSAPQRPQINSNENEKNWYLVTRLQATLLPIFILLFWLDMEAWWDVISLLSVHMSPALLPTVQNDGKLNHITLYHTSISSWVRIRIWMKIAHSLFTKYYNFYLYWNWFGDVVEIRILLGYLWTLEIPE